MVVDAGVILEIAVGGPRAEPALAVIRGHRPEAPGHALIEAVGVLRRLATSRSMALRDAEVGVHRVLAFPARLHEIGPDLAAAAWQHRDNLTIADAVYAVLASRLRAPLVTLDRAFVRAPRLHCEIVVP